MTAARKMLEFDGGEADRSARGRFKISKPKINEDEQITDAWGHVKGSFNKSLSPQEEEEENAIKATLM